MRLTLAAVVGSARRLRSGPAFSLVEEYLERAATYAECKFESFQSETGLLQAVERRAGRMPAYLLLFDSRGKQMSSEEFALHISGLRDSGRQHLMLAIGPASGWSTAAQERADVAISLGRMTLPHALAQAVAAEQIYRALTILAGHPYHSGH